MLDVGSGDGGSYFTATNIYLTPTTLSAITFNFLMSLSGGMLAAFVVSKGDVLWVYYGGLAGVIGASAGNDLYHPIQALIIGMGGAWVAYKGHFFAERVFKIDDPLGACAVHGYAGVYGLLVAGFMLWGYPASMNPDYAHISPLGQLAGAAIMFGLLGFLPGFIIAKILNAFGVLRVPRGVELAGLDLREIHTRYEEKEELRAALAKEPING
jgi:ammonia channel protein AmtB